MRLGRAQRLLGLSTLPAVPNLLNSGLESSGQPPSLCAPLPPASRSPTAPRLTPISRRCTQGTGTATEMALEERQVLAVEGIVIASVDVLRDPLVVAAGAGAAPQASGCRGEAWAGGAGRGRAGRSGDGWVGGLPVAGCVRGSWRRGAAAIPSGPCCRCLPRFFPSSPTRPVPGLARRTPRPRRRPRRRRRGAACAPASASPPAPCGWTAAACWSSCTRRQRRRWRGCPATRGCRRWNGWWQTRCAAPASSTTAAGPTWW